MKKLFLILLATFISGPIWAQTKKLIDVMNDSLYKQIQIFDKILRTNLEKPLVTQTDLDNFYSYLDKNMDTTVFSTSGFFPKEIKRDSAKVNIRNNFNDIIGGKNIKIEFEIGRAHV